MRRMAGLYSTIRRSSWGVDRGKVQCVGFGLRFALDRRQHQSPSRAYRTGAPAAAGAHGLLPHDPQASLARAAGRDGVAAPVPRLSVRAGQPRPQVAAAPDNARGTHRGAYRRRPELRRRCAHNGPQGARDRRRRGAPAEPLPGRRGGENSGRAVRRLHRHHPGARRERPPAGAARTSCTGASR